MLRAALGAGTASAPATAAAAPGALASSLGLLLALLLLLSIALLPLLPGIALLLAVPVAGLLVLAALLRRLRALAALPATGAVSLPFATPRWPPLLARIGTGRTAALAPLPPFPRHLLLEFLDLSRHVLARGGVLLRPKLVVAAVRAALPTLGIGAFTGGAEDALRERHVEPVAHCTLPPVARNDAEERRKTLRTLIELAEGSSPADCWDDRRAEDLLRSQTTPAEARSLGMSEALIERVFGTESGGKASGEGRAASGKPAPANNEQRPSDQRPATSEQRKGSFTVRVEARFEAAHYLREYRGITEPLHGHSYKVEAELAARGGGVDNESIAVDFVSAKRKLEVLAKRLDYGCINDVPPFTSVNPSAENIAAWFHRELSAAVADESAVVTAVTVWEGPVNSVTFRAGG